jgi:hypothetical protein
MANETRTNAAQPDSRNDRRIEDRRDDGSSGTGYAGSDEPLRRYFFWLGEDHPTPRRLMSLRVVNSPNYPDPPYNYEARYAD